MSTGTTNYVMYISRCARRRNPTVQSITLLEPAISDILPAGHFAAGTASDILTIPGSENHAMFAFWSVTGGTEGPQLRTRNQTNGHIAPVATAGRSNMNATAWYIPISNGPEKDGSGGGEIIDAFNVNTGSLILEGDFVNMMPDASINESVNAEGFIPLSTDHTQFAEAFSFQQGIYPFLNWEVISGGATVSDSVLTLPPNTTGAAFAFYKLQGEIGGVTPPREPFPVMIATLLMQALGFVYDDHGIPHSPVTPDDYLIARLLIAPALLGLSKNMNEQLKSSVTELAAAHLESIAQDIRKSTIQIKPQPVNEPPEK